MNNEKLPIKFFAHRDIDKRRVEGGGNNDPPNWLLPEEELTKRAFDLNEEFNALKLEIIKRNEKESTIPIVFLAKLCEDATAKSRRHDVTSMFQTKEHSNVIGMTSSDELMIRIDSIEDMEQISSRITDPDNNKYALSCLESFSLFKPKIVRVDGKQNYKVKLQNFNKSKNSEIQKQFETTLNSENIQYKKREYADNLTVYNLQQIQPTTLDTLEKHNIFGAIFSMEPMPRYTVKLDSYESTQEVPINKPKDNQHYVTIGILDSGIARIPHLDPWLNKKRWTPYPDSNIDPDHGTFVASIVIYGDECEKKKWVGGSGTRVFDATVFPDIDKEGIEEDELIENIKEAIKYNCAEVKIWNLSMSIKREVADDKFSDFAIALDYIQDKYKVLICKSAGNCDNFLFGKPKGRIHEGADSVRSLVVGSIAHKEGGYNKAEIDNPSPFSRIGPGPEYIIKPELVHYGGNAGIDLTRTPIFTGVTSFSKYGTIKTSIGTSFSTPRVTSLAAGIYQELNEKFDPLLLKSLVIHSATYSKKLKIPNKERTKHVGFGCPKTVADIIYNAPYEATLILRGKLVQGEYIDITDFPMPDCLIRNGFFTGQIIATLVYDPILDHTQGAEYCQSNIDIKFGSYDDKTQRDTTKPNILNPVGRRGASNLFLNNLYSKRRMKSNSDDFALKERLLIQYKDKYYPVKKYAVDLSELKETKYLLPNKLWYLSLRGLYRDHTASKAEFDNVKLEQEFSLIITVRDSLRKAAVYDEVSQKLDQHNFWHSNIKLVNDISISIDSK